MRKEKSENCDLLKSIGENILNSKLPIKFDYMQAEYKNLIPFPKDGIDIILPEIKG